MTPTQPLHPIRLQPPYYEESGRTSLHRYLDTEFINRFRQDVQHQRYAQPQFSAWLEEETHSQYDTHPVLRLPTHRAFHLVCCEVVCERLGRPALDPRRITSAGFAIRRIGEGQEQAWMLEDGEALGWQDAPTQSADPDIHRRLCANGVLDKRASEPAYSGEQTHPLHVLDSRDAAGKRHTLLFGFVPLGGFYYARNRADLFDAAAQQQFTDAAGQILSWPFGYRDAGRMVWRRRHTKPIEKGVPSKPMFELLRLLVNSYHLGEPARAQNAALEALCAELWFFAEAGLPARLRRLSYNEHNRELFARHRRSSLTAYLQACFAQREDNPLVAWIIRQEEKIDAAGGLDQAGELEPLPNANGEGNLQETLLMLAADAQILRNQLDQRLRDQTLAQAQEIPLPKFAQGEADIYQIVPFVRARNDAGKEQIQWADARHRSMAFRVAAPFDPEASRPSLIQMPSLRDLKRGLAKGASILTPGDTFDMINALKLKKGVSPDLLDGGGPKLGIQWICSFSLPVITLVAMILLMIMISLLNIVFFWLPWVRICLPFPKVSK